MKRIKSLAVQACFIISASSLTACASGQEDQHKKAAKGDGFAVLELFTSEGCSSCPPADKLLAEIQAETTGKHVYVLAYHVDYWDRQGWKDRYSSPEYSRRQAQYENWLGTSQVYTPQLVINGRKEFVGSDASAIRKAITEQLSIAPEDSLRLEASQDGKKLKIRYQFAGATRGNNLLIALVQKSAQSKVGAGENAGRALAHVQIVSQLQSEKLNKEEGSATITLPPGFQAQNWEVLALVQNERNGSIRAAARSGWNDSPTQP